MKLGRLPRDSPGPGRQWTIAKGTSFWWSQLVEQGLQWHSCHSVYGLWWCSCLQITHASAVTLVAPAGDPNSVGLPTQMLWSHFFSLLLMPYTGWVDICLCLSRKTHTAGGIYDVCQNSSAEPSWECLNTATEAKFGFSGLFFKVPPILLVTAPGVRCCISRVLLFVLHS